MFTVSRDLKIVRHLLFGMPSLTVLLLFFGMATEMMRIASGIRGYLSCLKTYAFGHLRVYTVFFAAQTILGIMYYHVDAGQHGIGRRPFDLGSIAAAYTPCLWQGTSARPGRAVQDGEQTKQA
jgi:hypothetical protein